MKKTKVVILGGGFGGLYAAMYLDKRLARREDVEVTLISSESYLLFTPLLHEVAAGDLSPGDIINSIRRIIHHIRFVEAEVRAIDFPTRRVQCVGGIEELPLEFEFDHLLIALGSETNFFDLPGVSDWAVTMKHLMDAALLRNRILVLLEAASIHEEPAVRRRLLTFVTAGGGFSGVETTGAINDYVRYAVRFYPELTAEMIRIVIVHAGEVLLPELGEKLGRYAERKLCERKVEVFKGVRVANYDGALVSLSDGRALDAATLIWTAGVKANPAIAGLPCPKERGRLLVNECLAVPDHPGLWAVGDCAAVPIAGKAGQFHPPTAQHGLREAKVAARNIEAAILGRPLKPFVFTTLGQLASIGHRTGVARIFGVNFSGFFAWLMWRTIYLLKLPRLSKKLRVMMAWTMQLFFAESLEQIVTRRDIEEMASIAERIRSGLPATRSATPPAIERIPNRNELRVGDDSGEPRSKRRHQA